MRLFVGLLLLLGWVSLARELQITDENAIVIDVGNIRPEGVYADGTGVLFTQLLYGGVDSVDISSQQVTNIVPSADMIGRRVAVSVQIYQQYMMVLGGAGLANSLLIYDNGSLLATCTSSLVRFLGDFTVVDDVIFVTDALQPTLWTVPVAQAIAQENDCQFSGLSLPIEYFESKDDGDFQALGIVPYANGLLIGTTVRGGLFYFDRTTNEFQVVLFPGSIRGVYGMDIQNDVLYAVQIAPVMISVHTIETVGTTVTATWQQNITTDLLDHPRRVSATETHVWVANARLFSTDGFPAVSEENPELFTERFALVGLAIPTTTGTTAPTMNPNQEPVFEVTPIDNVSESPTSQGTGFPTTAPIDIADPSITTSPTSTSSTSAPTNSQPTAVADTPVTTNGDTAAPAASPVVFGGEPPASSSFILSPVNILLRVQPWLYLIADL